MNALKIKRGDQVVVIAGSSKGKKGKVITTDAEKDKVLVEGVNMQKHHTKARSAKQTGGIISKEGFIDVSNVMVVCPKCGKAVRVKFGVDEKGKKVRICGNDECKAVLDKAVVKKASKKADAAAEKKPAKKATKKADTAEKKPAKKAPAKKTAKADAEEPKA